MAERNQKQNSQINFKSIAGNLSSTMTPIQGFKNHQALNPSKTNWQPHKKKTFTDKITKNFQNKKQFLTNTTKPLDRGVSSLEICDEISQDGGN